ncbi:MAG: alkaline phosphatase, partial [Planctomycetes bacterium]|nr:alkaline phosphatase [Planctomycetota bacterium]
MYRTLSHCSNDTPGRRAFIKQNALYLVPSLLPSLVKTSTLVAHENNKNAIRIGLITDSHFANKNAAGSRHYRDSLFKIRQAVTQFNNSRIPIAIELGDFIDAADTAETELQYLHTINNAFQKFNGKRHYVLGNHCVWTLSKKHFLSKCEQNKSFYSFDHHGIHFIILDACFRSDTIPYGEKNYDWTDTEIPPNEQDWLTEDLKTTPYPTVCFVHQRLDVSNVYG